MVLSWQNVSKHDHLCMVYETPEEQAAAFVPFLQAGLAQNEQCFYIVDESDPDWVISQLRSNEFPIDGYLARGAFKILHTRDVYVQKGRFDIPTIMTFWNRCISDALAAGYKSVRATGEMTWALRNFPGCDQLVLYEERVNTVLPTAHMTGLCQYNRKKFDAKFVSEVIDVHPFVCVSNHLMHNPQFGGGDKDYTANPELELRSVIDQMMMARKLTEATDELAKAVADKEAAELALKSCERQTQQLADELQLIARVVSHELETPLSSINSYLGVLRARYRDQLGSDGSEYIDKAVLASELSLRIVDGLWTYARVSPGDDAHPRTSVASSVSEVVAKLNDRIVSTNATIKTKNLTSQACIAPDHFAFLLESFIDNAIKYKDVSRTPHIEISCKATLGGVLLSVQDNGRGIDPVHNNDVFKPFFRVDGQPNSDGIGMRLAICKRIVQQYDGKIWFDSKVNNQTTFYVLIPAKDNEDPAE